MSTVDHWIAQLHASSYEARLEASEQLVALGEDAVPGLIKVACATKVVARMRAIEALGEIGSRWAFWPLAELTFPDEDFDLLQVRQKALAQIAQRLAVAPVRSDAAWFIAILRKFRFDIYSRPVAIAAAQGTLKLAQTDPCAELLPVLTLLKGNFIRSVPPEFGPLRKALLPLLADWKDLPVAADAPLLDGNDLPRPSQAE